MASNRYTNVEELIKRTNILERQMLDQLRSKIEGQNDASRKVGAGTQSMPTALSGKVVISRDHTHVKLVGSLFEITRSL